MDHMAILAKTQKRHEGKSERGGCKTPLLRERVKTRANYYIIITLIIFKLINQYFLQFN